MAEANRIIGAVAILLIITLSGLGLFFFSAPANEKPNSSSSSTWNTSTSSVAISTSSRTSFIVPTTTTTTETTTSAATIRNQLWFAPLNYETCSWCTDKGSVDFFDLFKESSPWVNASRHVDVFKFYGGEVMTFTDAQLRQAVSYLNSHGIAIAFEAGPLTPTANCGNGIEGFPDGVHESVTIANRIKAAGGVVRYIAMDEPLSGAYFYSGPQACHWSPEKVAAEVEKYIQAVRGVFPNVVVGDIEVLFRGARADVYGRWMSAFKNATGSTMPFFHLDVNWGILDWPEAAMQIEAVAHEQGVKFGIIYDGDWEGESDQTWLSTAQSRFVTFEAQYGARPDQVIFQSWSDKPDHILPETQPYTFTNLILQYFKERTAMSISLRSESSNGTRLFDGTLKSAAGTPMAGASVHFIARMTDGSGTFAEYVVSGTVPMTASRADVGFRVNQECECGGVANFDLYWVRYDEGASNANLVPNWDFSQGMNQWGYWGNGSVGLEPSDRAPGSMLHVAVARDQTVGMNSADFAVTPGANYTVTFGAKIEPGSVGSGYFSLVFLGLTESSRRTIDFNPPLLSLGSATTDFNGGFGLTVPALPPGTFLIEAQYPGDDTYWPAYAETTVVG